MTYEIYYYDELPVATVRVPGSSKSGVASTALHDMVLASFDDQGTLLSLDIQDTTMFGTPFDQAAAQRAIDWAREILAGNATA